VADVAPTRTLADLAESVLEAFDAGVVQLGGIVQLRQASLGKGEAM
jgi:hypothetical protein